MLIAIISDVHNNEVNLKKVLNYCKENSIKTIICCGDLASDETLDFLNDNFSGTIHYAFGNMDNDQLRNSFSPARGEMSRRDREEGAKKYKNTFLYKDFGETEIENRKIAFVHFPEIAKKLAEAGKYDFVFYGHTHKPWEEMINMPASAEAPARQCKMLNPGNVAGEIYPPTFAVWEIKNNNFKLIRIHDLK
jgi:uncharacterized protein